MVTLQQFRETLPWPSGNQVVSYRTGGIDAAITRRLVANARGREPRVVAEKLPLMVDLPVAAGGGSCN